MAAFLIFLGRFFEEFQDEKGEGGHFQAFADFFERFGGLTLDECVTVRTFVKFELANVKDVYVAGEAAVDFARAFGARFNVPNIW